MSSTAAAGPAPVKLQKKKPSLPEGERVERSLWQQTWHQFKRNKLAMAGLGFILFLLLIVLGTTAVDIVTDKAFYDQHVINQNLSQKLAAPSAEHIFGCDEYGRDIFFRMLWGTKMTLFIGLVAVFISIVIGGTLGALAGYYGGRVDDVIMRVMDVFLAIPSMVLAIAVVTALGTSTFNLLLSLAAPRLARFARVARAAVMAEKDKEFVEAARAVGANDLTILFQYILPNALAPILVQASLGTGDAVLAVAGLSYLGLGVQPPMPEWGSILTSAKIYMRDAWHISVIPGLGIMLAVLAFNLLGDGMRDALDPKLKN